MRIGRAALLAGSAALLSPSPARAEPAVFVVVEPMPAPTVQTFPAQVPPVDLATGRDSDIRMSLGWSGASHRGTFDGTAYTISDVSGITVGE